MYVKAFGVVEPIDEQQQQQQPNKLWVLIINL